MKVFKFPLIFLVLFASSVFAQTTHMGVPPDDMVVLTAFCSEAIPDSCKTIHDVTTHGSTYDRVLSDGKLEQDFKIPLRKILVITDWEWSYSETTVMDDSANDAVRVILHTMASISETSLRVTDGDLPFTTQGHASGATQMTSGFVATVLPEWRINRGIIEAPSTRIFRIVLRGYLLNLPI